MFYNFQLDHSQASSNANLHIYFYYIHCADIHMYVHAYVYKVEPCWWVIDGPKLHKHAQLVSSKYGLISHEVVKIVNNDSHKEIEKLQSNQNTQLRYVYTVEHQS